MSVPETEGTVAFNYPTLPRPATTSYKIYGDLKSGKTPLVILHGGPGACHEYMLPYADVTRHHGIPTIFYDQIGNGKGTRYREKMGDHEFWSIDLFTKEMENLLDHLGIRETGFSILGHSWGGMLGVTYATTHPKGLKRLVIANSPANMDLWIEATGRLKKRMPQDIQEIIDHCESNNDFENPAYQKAVMAFYEQFLCRKQPFPAPELQAIMDHLEDDMTTYLTMCGPSEFSITGNLRHWTIIDDLHKVEVPTLVLNGIYDEAQTSTVEPFFERIPHVKWLEVDEASHLAHVDQRERVMPVVGNFLSWS